jgi:CDP-diacylglycerol--serine O-phosphatidyltransferase
MLGAPRLARPRRRFVPIRQIVPNLLTTVSLCSGLASIHFSLKGGAWDQALAALAVAAVFDALDGRTARLLRATTRFGAVFDSLADFLAFGVAPAMLLHQWILKTQDAYGLGALTMFVLCSALRLARFTAAPQRPRTNPAMGNFFVGMPMPAAAAAVLIPVMLDVSPTFNIPIPGWVVVAYTFLVSWLMISRQPMYSFKRIRINRRLAVPLMVVVGLAVVMLTKDPWLLASIVAAAYLLSLPASIVAYRRIKSGVMEPLASALAGRDGPAGAGHGSDRAGARGRDGR